MVLQVKIPNIYYIDDHHPDRETGWIKFKIKYGGEDTGKKKQLIFTYHKWQWTLNFREAILGICFIQSKLKHGYSKQLMIPLNS